MRVTSSLLSWYSYAIISPEEMDFSWEMCEVMRHGRRAAWPACSFGGPARFFELLILPFSVAVSIVVHRPFAALSAVDGISHR